MNSTEQNSHAGGMPEGPAVCPEEERREGTEPMNPSRRALRGSLLLLLGSVIWGFAFAAQRMGMDYMQPISFNGIRNLMAGLCLIPVCFFAERRAPRQKPDTPARKKAQIRGGLFCGAFLFAASTLQQAGLVECSAGKAGFITALYVVLVPVFAWLLFHKNPGRWIRISILLAVAGLYLLCVPAGEGFSVSRSELLLLGCAACFTGEILSVDYYAPTVSGVRLSRDMFLFCGIMGVGLSLGVETITWSGIRQALPALLYAGVMSGAVAYTLQILGQRDVNPALASLIMCLESVFSVLGGALVLHESLTGREAVGCAVMFGAVVLSQLSPLLKKTRMSK